MTSKQDSLNLKFKIHLITTGGTIEKTYDEQDGTLFNRETVMKNAISKKLRLPYTDICLHSIMAKDSLEMGQSDREHICAKVKELSLENHPIVILHGTDTMQNTAEYMLECSCEQHVPIIFTGAMKPFGFEDSDAIQNVTEALMAAKIVAPGVYISFHNRLFTVPGVRKNKNLRSFEGF